MFGEQGQNDHNRQKLEKNTKIICHESVQKSFMARGSAASNRNIFGFISSVVIFRKIF